MITKIKLILLTVCLFILGLAGEAKAFYTTVRSTAVQISSAAAHPGGMELLSIRHSTGSAGGNAQFIILVDTYAVTAPLSELGQTLQGGTTLQNVSYGRGQWPVYQYPVPPIMVSASSGTANGANVTTYDFRDENGCGIPINLGLVALQPGTDFGTVVTVEWRATPLIGPCKQ